MPWFYPRPSTVFDPPTTLQEFLDSPIKFFARRIYRLSLHLRGAPYTVPPAQKSIRVVCLSDTHRHTQEVPPGDLLIHAGDLTNAGTIAEIQAQLDWLNSLPHRKKVVIAGNHDSYFDPLSRKPEDRGSRGRGLDWGDIHYLEKSSITLDFPHHNGRTLNLHGAPQIPDLGDKDFAFQYPRHQDAWSHTIPPDTDVLITHTPPQFHLDLPAALGCKYLLQEMWRVRPLLHIFGHIHSAAGKQAVFWDETQAMYEGLCARTSRGLPELLEFGAWQAVLKLVRNAQTSRIGKRRGTWMINAALAYQSTGRLGNPVQSIDI
ncbi:MAG: hypothetical protein M1817_002798 [Caeruleum heppii]|nr:MAG: hypothetical protein M1817_002798 [Caeruleum heppii]